MAERESSGPMIFIVGGLVVAVAFVLYFLFGDQITSTAPPGDTNVSVETTTGSSSEGGSDSGTTTSSDGATTGSTDGATTGSTDSSSSDSTSTSTND